jgi:hypothetical protein
MKISETGSHKILIKGKESCLGVRSGQLSFTQQF